MQRAGLQKRTMFDMRSIGIVFESYAIDNEVYPGGSVTEMTPVDRLLPDVQPFYIRKLPLNDAWGHPFLFWSDGQSYRIVSPGLDGLYEADYTNSPGLGATDPKEFGRDIVFADGQYEQWPEAPQTE